MKKAISKLWQRFKKHIDNIFFIFILLLLAALAVDVMYSDDTVRGLQELLRLKRNEKYEVLQTIGFCVVGVLLVWQAWAANKRANAMDATAKNAEAGQRQERLKNAIEHLGHKRDSVRMGGAYELFHLAKDTRGLRQTVMDILCAHIRQTTGEDKYKKAHETKPSEEIQSLLTLLFAQENDVFEDCYINLRGSYLNGATLVLARLKKAGLIETQLQGASLFKAQLQGAIFMDAQLQGANLSGAQLQGTHLYKAQLQGADLSGAQRQGADFSGAQLQGADLSGTQLQGANLMEAQLQGANLFRAQLQGANLMATQLQGVRSRNPYPHPSAEFEIEIRNRIDEPSDLTGIIFAGGLQEEDLDTLCEGLSAEKAQALREKLSSHVGKPASNELPEDSGADTRTSYTKEEAKQWIAKYNKAMEKAPR